MYVHMYFFGIYNTTNCDVKYITTYTNYFTTMYWHSLKKLRKVLISFRVSVPRGMRKKHGKAWLTYEKQFKWIERMTRKKMRELMRE